MSNQVMYEGVIDANDYMDMSFFDVTDSNGEVVGRFRLTGRVEGRTHSYTDYPYETDDGQAHSYVTVRMFMRYMFVMYHDSDSPLGSEEFIDNAYNIFDEFAANEGNDDIHSSISEFERMFDRKVISKHPLVETNVDRLNIGVCDSKYEGIGWSFKVKFDVDIVETVKSQEDYDKARIDGWRPMEGGHVSTKIDAILESLETHKMIYDSIAKYMQAELTHYYVSKEDGLV